jgi:uncharacterized membrane protein
MTGIRQRRLWLLVAAIAIVAVLCLLVQQTHSSNSVVWLAILPVFFIGLLFPLDTPWRAAIRSAGSALEPLFHRSSLQRPPPVRLG